MRLTLIAYGRTAASSRVVFGDTSDVDIVGLELPTVQTVQFCGPEPACVSTALTLAGFRRVATQPAPEAGQSDGPTQLCPAEPSRPACAPLRPGGSQGSQSGHNRLHSQSSIHQADLGGPPPPDPIVLDQLRGPDFAEWRGLGIDDVIERDPAGFQIWLSDPWSHPHGGESLADHLERIGNLLDTYAWPPRSAVIVASPMTLRAACVHALGAGPTALAHLDIAPLTVVRLSWGHPSWRLQAIEPCHPGRTDSALLPDSAAADWPNLTVSTAVQPSDPRSAIAPRQPVPPVPPRQSVPPTPPQPCPPVRPSRRGPSTDPAPTTKGSITL